MRRRRNESGFALLLVFMMSAAVSIMLYKQLPRAAFEAQRAKEEMLQDRGEQYIRAIQLYVVKWRSYPPSLEALEKTNNVRFLRRRYKDPMTGKDEWRAVHVNAAGVLVDSIVQKQEQKKEAPAEFVSILPGVGSTAGTTGETAPAVAMRRRPSDNAPAVDPQALGNGAYVAAPSSNAPAWNAPQPFDPNAGQPVQNPAQPVQAGGQQPGLAPGQPGTGGQPPGAPQPGMPNWQPPGFPQQGSNNPQQQQQPATANAPYPAPGAGGNPMAPPAPGQPGQPGGPQNAGLDMINRILTTPRSGMNMSIPGANGLNIGGGIAGFASTYEAPSIKVYNERQKYNEWEFIYDMKKDKRLLGAAAGANQNMQNMMNRNPLMNQGAGPTPAPPPSPSPAR